MDIPWENLKCLAQPISIVSDSVTGSGSSGDQEAGGEVQMVVGVSVSACSSEAWGLRWAGMRRGIEGRNNTRRVWCLLLRE